MGEVSKVSLQKYFVGWVKDYFAFIDPYSLLFAVLAFAIAAPVIYTLGGRQFKLLGPRRILFFYVVLIVFCLLATWALGLSLYYIAPDLFDRWQPRYSVEPRVTPFRVLSSLIYLLPVAVAVSSALYGILAGIRGIALAIFGVILAIGLAALSTVAMLFVGCYGWSVCI